MLARQDEKKFGDDRENGVETTHMLAARALPSNTQEAHCLARNWVFEIWRHRAQFPTSATTKTQARRRPPPLSAFRPSHDTPSRGSRRTWGSRGGGGPHTSHSQHTRRNGGGRGAGESDGQEEAPQTQQQKARLACFAFRARPPSSRAAARSSSRGRSRRRSSPVVSGCWASETRRD